VTIAILVELSFWHVAGRRVTVARDQFATIARPTDDNKPGKRYFGEISTANVEKM
jgi:hypothetical protein